jgi:hypothetical protein
MSNKGNSPEGSYNGYRSDVDVSDVFFVKRFEEEGFSIARIMDYPETRAEHEHRLKPDGSMGVVRVPVPKTPDEEQLLADLSGSVEAYTEAYGQGNIILIAPAPGLVCPISQAKFVTCAVIMVRGLMDGEPS